MSWFNRFWHFDYSTVFERFEQASVLVLMMLMALTVVGWAHLHYPIHPDEVVFFDMGEVFFSGGRLYIDMVDNKLPGIYLLAGVFGGNLVLVRVFMLMVQIGIGFLVARMARASSLLETLLIMSVYVALALHFQGIFLLTESFVGLGVLLSYIKFQQKQYFWCGMALGLACVFKQPVWILAPVYLWFISRSYWMQYVEGLVILPLSLIWWLSASGVLNEFIYHTILVVLGNYVSTSSYDWSGAVELLWPLVYVVPMVLFQFYDRSTAGKRLLILLLILSLIPVVFRAYHHYWLAGLPVLLLWVFDDRDIGRFERFAWIVMIVIISLGSLRYQLGFS